MTEPLKIPRQRVQNLDVIMSNSPMIDVRDSSLTLNDLLAPEKLVAKELRVEVGDLVRLRANDGACWATVTGVTALGRLILEPDAVPTPAVRRGRPPKTAMAEET